jgi:hypothetical protein
MILSLPELQEKLGSFNTKETDKYSLTTLDSDNDGLDTIVVGAANVGIVFDSTGKKIGNLQGKSSESGRDSYRMLRLDKIPANNNVADQLIGLSSMSFRLYGADSKITREIVLDIAPAGFSYDNVTKTLLFGSDIEGGDTIFYTKTDEPGWEQSLEELGIQGQQKTMLANIEKLSAQIEAFEPPSYQTKINPEIVCVFAAFTPHINSLPYSPATSADLFTNPSIKSLSTLYQSEFPYPSLTFASNQWISENWDRSALLHGWATKRDDRMVYQLTSKEIIDYAKMLEKEQLEFVWTIGHGNDPFFLSLKTVEGILLAAPNACKGFIIPEVSREDTPQFRYAVMEHIKPICDLCLKYGNRKMFLRSKYLFWIGDVKTDLWEWMLKDKKYKDVIVPAMEETNQRVCDVSISARLGLQNGGWFNDWAGRAVKDNLCYNRLYNWAVPTVGSNFLRALSYSFSLGTKYCLIQLGEADITDGKAHFRDHAQVVKPFLNLVGKGILPYPQKHGDKLSVSSVAVQMKTPTDDLMKAAHGGHVEGSYKADPKWVFSRMECFWGQAPTPKYDFGYYAIGRRRQALNFVPKNPYGIVPIVPEENSVKEIPGNERKIYTDGEVWYDEQGLKRSAEEYAPIVEKTLQEASEKLFCKVTGDIAWTATRLDQSHIRLVLIDPGYLDPADRIVKVKINTKALSVTDILSREEIALTGNEFNLTVAMGIIRVIDIEHI